ncbi:MAG: hypothetical protein Q4D60_04435 [Eubacteriales bacterium]|nr:hypothetical protein [Eubacteriales bacterium]
MTKILVQWTHTVDIICVPECIADDINKYQDEFLTYVNGVSFDEKLDGTVFGITNFVDYINQYVLEEKNQKAYVQCEDFVPNSIRQKKEMKGMKKIYF